jgi:hypothetical protein
MLATAAIAAIFQPCATTTLLSQFVAITGLRNEKLIQH